jgi:hypothetical protein
MRIFNLLFRWGSPAAVPSLFWRDTEVLARSRGQFANSQERNQVALDRFRGEREV